MYAKAGTEKGEKFVEALKGMIEAMKKRKKEGYVEKDDESEEI